MLKFVLLSLLSLSAFAQDIYKIQDTTIEGKPFKMSQLKGKTVLIVNIASQCGYTPQLEKLEALYQKYKAKNFVVLGVPTNDFGGQTPEDDGAMKEFCQKKYSVTFPLLKKGTVLGKETRPLYQYLTTKSIKAIRGEVGWNFEKFLISKKGKIVTRMGPMIDPTDPDTMAQIEQVL